MYDNLQKALLFILPTNGGETLAIFAAIGLGRILPITPVQILWVNMITAVTLALTLALEPTEPDAMHHPPRPPDQPLLPGVLLRRIAFVSLILARSSLTPACTPAKLWGNRYVWLTVTVVLGIQISFTYLPLMQQLFGTRLGTVRDRLSTDIAMSHRAGVLGVLVLTGEATASDAGKTQNPPDLVVPGLMEFGALLRDAQEGGR